MNFWGVILILAIIGLAIFLNKARININGKDVTGFKKIPYGVLGAVVAILAIAIAVAIVVLVVSLGIGLIGVIAVILLIAIPVLILVGYFTVGIKVNNKLYKFRNKK